jgi:hypothetical protein
MARGIVRRIFTLAECLEPDRRAIWEWLLHDPIDVLRGYTAMELIFADQGEQVETLLRWALWDEENGGVTDIYRSRRVF